MERKISKNLKNIRKFYETIAKEKCATREEMYNFFVDILNFIFEKNSIDLKKYKVNLHFVKPKTKTNNSYEESQKSEAQRMMGIDTVAIMYADNKDENEFDVYFNENSASFKLVKEDKGEKKKSSYFKKEKENTNTYEDYKNLFSIIYTVMHEFSHIIQYINKPEAMNKFARDVYYLDQTARNIDEAFENGKEKRLLLEAIKSYYKLQGYISPTEIDADKQAISYYKALVKQLLVLETDEEVEGLLCAQLDYLAHKKRHTKLTTRVLNKEKQEICAKAKGLNLDYLFSNYLN